MIYSLKNGQFRDISDFRNELIEFVQNEQWIQITPIKSHVAPYSIIGAVLAHVGLLGHRISIRFHRLLTFSHLAQSVTSSIGSLNVGLLLFLSTLIMLLLATTILTKIQNNSTRQSNNMRKK